MLQLSAIIFFIGCKNQDISNDTFATYESIGSGKIPQNVTVKYDSKYYSTVNEMFIKDPLNFDYRKIPGNPVVNLSARNDKNYKQSSPTSNGIQRIEDFVISNTYSGGDYPYEGDSNLGIYTHPINLEQEKPFIPIIHYLGLDFLQPEASLYAFYDWRQFLDKNYSLSYLQVVETLTKRNVSIVVNIPFAYYRYRYGNQNAFRFASLPGEPGYFSVVGTNMGLISGDGKKDLYSQIDTSSSNGNFEGCGLRETRTKVISTDGQVKISTSANPDSDKNDSELERHFIVSKTVYMYTDYSCKGNFHLIQIDNYNSPLFTINWKGACVEE